MNSYFGQARFIFAAFALFLVLVRGEVRQLTADDFDDAINSHEHVLVKFYAPWCGHCKVLAPEYIEAAKRLKESGVDVVFAEVDATVHSDLASKYGVSGYPTMRFFRNQTSEDYTGGRKADDMVAWVTRNVGPAVTVVASEEGALSAAKDDKVAFVGSFTSEGSALHKQFVETANKNRSAGVFIAYFASDKSEEIRALHKGEDFNLVFTPNSEGTLTDFITNAAFPPLGTMNGETYGDYIQHANALVWVCGNEGQVADIKNVVVEVAMETRNSHLFAWLDTSEERFEEHAVKTLGAEEFPAIIVQTKGSDSGRYVFPTKNGKGITVETLKDFLKKVSKNEIEKFVMSEPIPESNDEPVKIVVAKQFNEMVLRDDADVFLEVYAPWCGHCKTFLPIYEEFAQLMSNNKHVVVAKMDGTANDSVNEHFQWRGFPTIFFVKAGSQTPMDYDGARTVEGLKSFLFEHSSFLDTLLADKPTPAPDAVADEL